MSARGEVVTPEGSSGTGSGIAGLGRNPDVWIVPEFKVVYVATAKNACTTLKWVIADLAREDRGGFSSGLKPYVDDEQAVHNRDCFANARYPSDLDSAALKQIHPDSGWFVFGVVRDPRSRLFSAWQDKLLLNEPGFRWARERPWFPQPARDTPAIISEFARFVDIATSEQLPLFENDHFRSQVGTLLVDVIPYSRIYPIEEMAQLRTDLSTHVQSLGWSGPLEFRRSNDNPLRATAAVFADGVRDKIETLYAADFAAYGQLWDFARIEAVPDWTPAQMREVEIRAALGHRLGDVRHIALGYRDRAEQASGKVEKLQGERMKLENRLTRLEGRLTKMDGRLTKLDGRLTDAERQAGATARELRKQRQAAARRPIARAKRLAGRLLRSVRRSGG